MAAAHVQLLGTGTRGSAWGTTTVISPSSKTVTIGNTIVVGFGTYLDVTATGITDNLGNTYVRIERVGGTSTWADLWYAPVTHAGSITSVTIAHANTHYTDAIASEFSGIAASPAVGGGAYAITTTVTWAASKTIPANGIVIGVASSDNVNTKTFVAGAASGSPSTSISTSGQEANGACGVGLYYAIAGASAVTTFTGTTTFTTGAENAGAGGIFNPAAAVAAVPPNFLPFFWA